MNNLDIKVLWEVEQEKNIDNLINTVVKKALEMQQVTADVELSIVITDNNSIRKINKEFRDKDMPTDVLSFPGYEPEEIEEVKKSEELMVIGDIIISKEKVVEQAKEYENTFEREFAYLLVHGILHLLGYDHMEESEKIVMRENEEKILSELNLSR